MNPARFRRSHANGTPTTWCRRAARKDSELAMTRPRPRLWDMSPNRCLTDAEIAYYVGMSENSFAAKRPEWEMQGFPKKDALTERTDKALIDLWLDRRGGLATLTAAEEADRALDQWDA